MGAGAALAEPASRSETLVGFWRFPPSTALLRLSGSGGNHIVDSVLAELAAFLFSPFLSSRSSRSAIDRADVQAGAADPSWSVAGAELGPLHATGV